MYVAQLFNSFVLGPNIEVIKPRLPEAIRLVGNIYTGDAPGLAGFARPGTKPPPSKLRTKPSFSA
jgi:hypothetical protein